MPNTSKISIQYGPKAFEINPSEPNFPTVLHEVHPPVNTLFGLGSRPLVERLLNNPGIAIVGSRQATAQGCTDAQWFARELSFAGITVVSGLAQGIDAAAHRGGLEGEGKTIAVLGHGRDKVYPRQHEGLAHRIAEEGGCLLTEYTDGTAAIARHFPSRNRIIAALSRAVLVVEAAPKSGSLITAQHALELGIDVFVVPGSIHMPQSLGCNRLIRQGAQPVESPQQLLEDLGLCRSPMPTKRGQQLQRPDPLSLELPLSEPPHEALPSSIFGLLNHLKGSPLSIQALEVSSGRPASALYSDLLLLELKGLASRTSDGKWLRLVIK